MDKLQLAYNEGAAARSLGIMANPYYMINASLCTAWHLGWIANNDTKESK